MKSNKQNLSESLILYAVTDRTWLNGRTLSGAVRESLEGGATFIQLREKNLNEEEFLNEAREIKKLCAEYGVPFVINDNVEIALKVDADGVHVGQTDMEAGKTRRLIGDGKILGVSAETVYEAILAEKNGADYIGVGAVFPTGTKGDAIPVSLKTLREITEAVSVPVVAIGGINEENICELEGSGIAGIAVISAIFAKQNIKEATRSLLKKAKETVEK